MTSPQSFKAQWAAQAAAQQTINRMFVSGADAKAEILRVANAAHAQYAQYAGYWEGTEWLLGRATMDIVGKGGPMAYTGDVVLMRRSGDYVGAGYTFYSVRIDANCGVDYGVEPLMGWDAAFKAWRQIADERRMAARRALIASMGL